MCDCPTCKAERLGYFGGLYGPVSEQASKSEVFYPSAVQVGGEHYSRFSIQPSEFIHKNNLGWCEGNVVKYVCRHQFKNGAEDIKKAIHYLQLLLQWVYLEN